MCRVMIKRYKIFFLQNVLREHLLHLHTIYKNQTLLTNLSSSFYKSYDLTLYFRLKIKNTKLGKC